MKDILKRVTRPATDREKACKPHIWQGPFPPDTEYSTVKTPNFVSKGTKKLENTLPKAIQQTRTWRDTHEHWSSGTHKIKTLWEGAGQSEKPPPGWESIQKTGEQGQPLQTAPRAFSGVAHCRGTRPQQSQEATAPLCGFAGHQGELSPQHLWSEGHSGEVMGASTHQSCYLKGGLLCTTLGKRRTSLSAFGLGHTGTSTGPGTRNPEEGHMGQEQDGGPKLASVLSTLRTAITRYHYTPTRYIGTD